MHGAIAQGPLGLGTSAARAFTSAGYVPREWGDGTHPPLLVPEPVRINEPLGQAVNEDLVAWAAQTGIYADRLDAFQQTGFGRLAMLAHPETDDRDRLLLAAKMNAAWWASDDYYADEAELGAAPVQLPPRLAMVLAAMDPPPPAGEFTPPLEEAIRADPVLVALRSATEHLARYATPAQLGRVCNITAQMYVIWTAYAAWQHSGDLPPAWRYLAARQQDSFYTSMTLIDIIGGYRLPADIFFTKRVHDAVMRAGTASVIVNDLLSVEREAEHGEHDNLVLVIAADEKCSLDAAIDKAVALHNDLVRDFEAERLALSVIPSLELHRFLIGTRNWMGGGFEWHRTSDRYKTKASTA